MNAVALVTTETEPPTPKLMLNREQMLGQVMRWQIVPTIKQQSTAEHSFFVALLVPRIAALIRWRANNQQFYWLNRYALLHDSLEGITGDVPTPVKKYLPELKSAEQALLAECSTEYRNYMRQIADGVLIWSDIKAIVAFADSLEAAIFLRKEYRLGNRAVSTVLAEIVARLRTGYEKLPFGMSFSLEERQRVWDAEIAPLISDQSDWPVVA